MTPAHPAKFSDRILQRLDDMIAEHHPNKPLVLDPFAGVGKVHLLTSARTIGVEIEPEWALQRPGTVVGNTLHLPFRTATFDGIVTSPVYGNRHSDHHDARDGSRRHSYTHTIGRKLHPDNSGTIQWGDDYRHFHDRAWAECLRVLRPDGFVMVNVSNHIRKGVEQPVTQWHLAWFLAHRCTFRELERIETPRLRDGANRDARVPHEHIFHVRYHPEEASR